MRRGIQRDEETRAIKRATFARFLRPIRTRFPGTPRLLHCGAATGSMMEEAAALGMDPTAPNSQVRCPRIAEKFGADAPSAALRAGHLRGIDEDFFDIITMIDFIEHVGAPMSILVKASRLLRPGGQLSF